MPYPPQLDNCCCCCTTETGTKIIGWIQTISNILGTLVFGYGLVYNITHLNKPGKIELIDENVYLILPESTTVEDVAESAKSLVLYLFHAILNIYLLIGVYNRNMSYIRLWVVCYTVLLCIVLAIILIWIMTYIVGIDVEGGDIAESVISAIIEAYYILVVYSFYREEISRTG